MADTDDPDLKKALAWSHAVNKSIAEMVRACPPSLTFDKASNDSARRADMIVCSQTPCAALEAEWNEHDLAKYVVAICGQEIAS